MLYRQWQLPTYTISRLYVNTEFLCNTLEPPVRELTDLNGDGDFSDTGEGKVYGDTAIPDGTYLLTLTPSPKFKRMLPLLLRVPGFEGVRIHAGNSVADTDGCILPGENKMKGRVINSRFWLYKITGLIKKAQDNGKK